MKRILLASALAAASFASAFAADVGVSINIGQPGFYGRIDIGDYPQPRVIYSQPVIIERVQVSRPPIYLRVPPGHMKHWARHCARYNACGERVYFVQNTWYEREYVPRYRERHHDYYDHHDNDRGDHRDDHREHRRDDHDRHHRHDR